MILVDTSVWVTHFRAGSEGLAELLSAGRVLTHAFVVGELALGSLRQRAPVLDALRDLPQTVVADDGEVLQLNVTGCLAGELATSMFSCSRRFD